MGVFGQHHAPTALPQGNDPVPIVEEVGWAPGPVWTGAENLTPIGIWSPDRLVSSESLIIDHITLRNIPWGPNFYTYLQ
jgi:hypothetical protein